MNVYLDYKKCRTISKEGIFIDVDEEDLNKILEFQDLTKTETVSDAVMLAIKIAKFTLTYAKKKEKANDQQSE